MKLDMKTKYVLAIAAGLLCASCTRDADEVLPQSAQIDNPIRGGKPLTSLEDDWMARAPWRVDTLSRRIMEGTRQIVDTAYLNYGSLIFEKMPAGQGGRLGANTGKLMHTHPDLNGRQVTDTLYYFPGDYNTGQLSRSVITIWKGDAATAQKAVFRLKRNEKRASRFETQVPFTTDSGEQRTLIWGFTISR